METSSLRFEVSLGLGSPGLCHKVELGPWKERYIGYYFFLQSAQRPLFQKRKPKGTRMEALAEQDIWCGLRDNSFSNPVLLELT